MLNREARSLLHEARPAGTGIRLIGVRAENLLPAGSVARGLWDDDEPWREAETTADAVAERFGRGALTRASLLSPEERRRRSALSMEDVAATEDVGGLD